MTTLPRERRIWIVRLCTLMLVIGGFGAYFGPQIITYLKLRQELMRSPAFPRGWDSIPRPLVDSRASTAGGVILSHYGYEFEVPWKNIVGERNPEEWVETDFRDGQKVTFFDPRYLRDRVNRTSYEEYKTVISMTPSQLSPFCSHRQFANALSLLDMKGAWFEHNAVAPDIFLLKTPSYRGFEISGLSKGWNSVRLALFDATDRQFQFEISVPSSTRAKLTQSEINRMIQSFAPVSSNSESGTP